jgi:hypothetical protein
MLPSEFSAYIKQKEQIQQSRILPLPIMDNTNPIIPSSTSAIIRPPHYRHQLNAYATHSPINTTLFTDLPSRPNTLPLGSRPTSIHLEQHMTSSST